MFGVVPPFFTSYPYGAPPSSGAASTKFVDLFNDQTVAGKKSWVVAASGSESLAEWGVSDDAVSRILIENGTGTATTFVPVLRRVQGGTASVLDVYQGTTDTGSNAINNFRARIGASSSVVTRPLYVWQNNATSVMALSAAGGLSVAGGTAPSLTVGASGTPITQMRVYTPTIDPASVASFTTAEQTFTVAGLTTADKVIINKPTNTTGLGIVNARVSAADTLAITFGNFTAIAIDAASEVYSVIAVRS